MTTRQRVNALATLKTLSSDEHRHLRESGLADETVWSPKKEHPLYRDVASFKSEVKNYYYWGQECRCCYCSSELPKHGRSFDAEHILDKSTYRQFMFDLNNFGVACPVCNTHKSKKNVLTSGGNAGLTALPTEPDEYLIVHPHLDEWSRYLMIDGDGFIKSIESDGKGQNTIDICGIEAVNFTKLAVKFSLEHREDAYKLMCHLLTKKPSKKKTAELFSLLERLAQNTPQAQAAVRGLKDLLIP